MRRPIFISLMLHFQPFGDTFLMLVTEVNVMSHNVADSFSLMVIDLGDIFEMLCPTPTLRNIRC